MGFLEKLSEARQTLTEGVVGVKSGSSAPSKSKLLSQGVGNAPLPGSSPGAGYLGPWSEDRLTNVAILVRTGQVVIAFIILIIAVTLASFQSKWIKKLSGLSAILIIASVLTLIVTAIMLVLSYLPHGMEDKGERLVRILEQPRLALVMNGAGTAIWLLLALTQVISAFSMPGCKDPNKDPHAGSSTGKKEDYTKALPSFCTSKRAAAAVCWIEAILCVAMLLIFLHSWRVSRKNGPRIPPFVHPDDGAFEPLGDDLDGDTDNLYDQDKPTASHVAEPTTGPVPPAARYGDGGDGRYGDPRYNSGEYRYNSAAQPYDADPRMARAYGLNPRDMAYESSSQPARVQGNPFTDQGAAPRQSYDYGAYANAGAVRDPYYGAQSTVIA